MPEESDTPPVPKPSLSQDVPPPPPPTMAESAPPPAPVPADPVPEQVEDREVTTEAVAPAGTAVTMTNRILAAVIDAVIAAALSWIAVMIFPKSLDRFAWIVSAAYWIVRDSLPFLKAQSIGKMAMKLKVEKESGGSLESDWQTAFYRNIILAIPFGGLVELIVLLVRQGKPEAGRRLGDDWAKTKVVLAD